MPAAKTQAFAILAAFHKAEAELLGQAVIRRMEKLEPSRRFGSTSCTDYEFRSEDTRGDGQCQQSGSRRKIW
jgi:hypothetical protein